MSSSIFGHGYIAIALICSLISIFKHRWQSVFFLLSVLFLSFSFVVLLYAFISSNMSIKNVFLNSSLILPLIYKISALWSSHEGSLLLWTEMLSLVNFFYYWFCIEKLSKDASSAYCSLIAITQNLFLLLIITTSDPFESFSFAPEYGLGLNPMLQDMALAIHPPILYLGNLCFSAIFISSLVALLYPQYQQQIFASNKKLLNIAMFLLTIGIGLGAWWAYRELGWGGYWFFDPVENISIMPWLIGIVLHHKLLYPRNNQNRSIIILSLSGFLLILYGTFIVRSGIIASVHSFAFSPTRGVAILVICLILTILSAVIFLRSNFQNNHNQTINSLSMIDLANIFWMLILLLIIISLIYPIYCYVVNGEEVVIDVEYFHLMLLPIFIPLLLLSIFAQQNCSISLTNLVITPIPDKKDCVSANFPSPASSFRGRSNPVFLSLFFWIASLRSQRRLPYTAFILLFSTFLSKINVMGLIAAACSYYLHIKINLGIIACMICFASIFSCIYMLQYIFKETNFLQKPPSVQKISLFLGHFSFGLLALSVTLNVSLSKEIEFIGKVGDQVRIEDKIVMLEDIRFSQNNNYYRQIAVFKIEDNNNIIILRPENRLYKIENSLSQEVDIFSYLTHDVYAVISRITKDKDQEMVHATIHFQPLISFIWLSILLMSLGFIIKR